MNNPKFFFGGDQPFTKVWIIPTHVAIIPSCVGKTTTKKKLGLFEQKSGLLEQDLGLFKHELGLFKQFYQKAAK